MRSWTRPDGRCFVLGDVDAALPDGELYATVDERDAARRRRLEEMGFAVDRRELRLVLPTDPASTGLTDVALPDGYAVVRADAVAERPLRLLDDALRQDVPGTDGWRWSPEGFREETYASAAFDPAVYLVALTRAAREGAGIGRVWLTPSGPRLGLIGVLPRHRRRGLARALLAHVFAVLDRRGFAEVATEVDETNIASRALLEPLGARVVGATLELRRAL